MPVATSTIEVFLNEEEELEGEPSIGLVLCSPSIVEFDGDLTPGCSMTASQARSLAAALTELANQSEQ